MTQNCENNPMHSRDCASYHLETARYSMSWGPISCGHQPCLIPRWDTRRKKGRSMVASETYAEFLREQLAPLGRLSLRRMFGKTGVFCDGVMFAMVTDNTLYFRVDDHNREIFKEAESSPPLNYA